MICCKNVVDVAHLFLKEKWYVYNNFTTNPKWQVVTGYYC